MSNPQEQLEARISRLKEEQSYALPGWRVSVREVHAPTRSLRLCLKAWLMYPLLGAKDIFQA